MQPLIPPVSSIARIIHHTGDILIKDQFHGTIVCEGLLTIERRAEVSGEIHTRRAHIHGRFKGSMEATEVVIFSSGATFEGVLDAKAMLCPLDTTIIGEVRIEPSIARDKL